MIQTSISVASAFVAIVSVLIIGMKVAKFSQAHVAVELCNKRYKLICDKLTYTQLLLMEITTEEQQRRAREKIETFDFERACENG